MPFFSKPRLALKWKITNFAYCNVSSNSHSRVCPCLLTHKSNGHKILQCPFFGQLLPLLCLFISEATDSARVSSVRKASENLITEGDAAGAHQTPAI
mmetsp:Transcript_27699/g.50033  ORF Transcript_27699/g.50033 Transcript_27699/m.50033 type:complete len:97 (-) Transcript_27699:109-399(-)